MKKVKKFPYSGIHPNTLNDLMTLKSSRAELNRNQSRLFLSIGLCISLLFVISSFELRFYTDDKVVDLMTTNSEFENLIEVPPTEHLVQPPPKIVQPKIIEVSDEEEIIEEIEINLDIEMSEEQIIEDKAYAPESFEIEDESPEEIFTIVEQQPHPEGGYKAFYAFIGENLNYPAVAQRHNIQGKVYIQFVVEKDGSLTDISVVKGIGGKCEEEAIRILKLAPAWIPGKQRGKPVRVKMNLPIHFQLMNL